MVASILLPPPRQSTGRRVVSGLGRKGQGAPSVPKLVSSRQDLPFALRSTITLTLFIS